MIRGIIVLGAYTYLVFDCLPGTSLGGNMVNYLYSYDCYACHPTMCIDVKTVLIISSRAVCTHHRQGGSGAAVVYANMQYNVLLLVQDKLCIGRRQPRFCVLGYILPRVCYSGGHTCAQQCGEHLWVQAGCTAVVAHHKACAPRDHGHLTYILLVLSRSWYGINTAARPLQTVYIRVRYLFTVRGDWA